MNTPSDLASERDGPTRLQILIGTCVVSVSLMIALKAVEGLSIGRMRHEYQQQNLELYREIESLKAERDRIQADRDLIRLDIKAAQAKLDDLRGKRKR